MSQSSSFITLIVVSLLSCHSCDGVATKTYSDGLDGDGGGDVDQRKMLDNMLRGAAITLTVTFIVAISLPPSSTTLALNSDAFESSEMSQHSPKSSPELNNSCDSSTELNDSKKIDKGDVLKCDNEHPIVDCNDVKVLCTRRIQLSRSCTPRNLLQQHQRTCQTQQEYDVVPVTKACELDSISEYAGVPAVMTCDSLTSLSSDVCPSTKSSSDCLSLAPTKMTRKISSCSEPSSLTSRKISSCSEPSSLTSVRMEDWDIFASRRKACVMRSPIKSIHELFKR